MATADERLFQIFRHHETIHRWLVARRLLDVYQTTLLGWVISQMEWIARRTPPPLRRALFDTLVPIFAAYSQATVVGAVREGNKGVAAQRLSNAVAKREYGSFARALASRPESRNPLITAAFHLKHSGVRHTAVLAGRYLRNRAQGGRVTRVVGRVQRVGREPRRQDVMFGLMVIQQRLGGVESRLAEMQARLEAIEHRIAERGARPEPPSGVHEQGWYDSAGIERFEDSVGRG
jgi:hypothetical protein